MANAEPDHGEDDRDVVAPVQGLHRVLVPLDAHGHDADDGGEDPEGARDERKHHDADDAQIGLTPGIGGRHGSAQDHGADVLRRGGFEQVSASAGAVANVIADEIRDDRGVARVVLGDARFNLTDKVGADVGRFRVDAAAELGEQAPRNWRRSRSRR